MALDVWYKSDIQNALRAADQASGATLKAVSNADEPYVLGYQTGYRAALTTLALAFGLVPVESQPVHQPDLLSDNQRPTISEIGWPAWEEVR
jgi:hypothetical protein